MPTSCKKTAVALKAYYMSKEVAHLTGLTTYMVTYLGRIGLLIPVSPASDKGVLHRPQYGKARLYTFADLLLGRSLRKLLDAGVSVKEIEKSIRVLRDKLGGVPQDITNTRITIIGKRIYFAPPDQPPVELTGNGQLAFSYMLNIQQLQGAALKMLTARDSMDDRRVQRHERLLASRFRL
jgi:DNA-binding transcriptional MerR regulator